MLEQSSLCDLTLHLEIEAEEQALNLQFTCRTLSPSASSGAFTSLMLNTLWERLDSWFKCVLAMRLLV